LPGTSDEELVRAAVEDPRNFHLLYERYVDRVFWYALSRTRSAADADDVVSETMLAALEHLNSFDPDRGSFAGWLFTIARRKSIDHQRHHQRLLRFLARQRPPEDLIEEQGALERLMRDEEATRVFLAFQELSKADQDIITLRYSAGLSSKEISDVLGITDSAARMRVSRATRRLGELLGSSEG
jgi:RNA polymerase sigma-70 factor (ECF subfamily)